MEYMKIYALHHAVHPFCPKLITQNVSFNILTDRTGVSRCGRFIFISSGDSARIKNKYDSI